MHFPVYILGFCPYTGKYGLEKTFIFAYVQLSLLANLDKTMAKTIFTRPHITHSERKNSRSDISTLTAYEIASTTMLKHVFHETKHEEVYIRIIILKLNAYKIKNKLDFYTDLLIIEILHTKNILSTKYVLLMKTGSSQ